MLQLLTALVLIAAVFMGISIGSSAVPPAFGPVTSSGKTGVLKAALIAGLAALSGALLQGGRVTSTVGGDMISGEIVTVQALAILTIASILVIISVLTKYPMPTAFTIVGAVIGSALSFDNMIQWNTIHRIIGYWLLVPILALVSGYVISYILEKYVPEQGAENLIRNLTLIMGTFVAFTAGANSVGKAVGPLLSLNFSINFLLLLGGLSILVGSWVLSPKIIDAVSFEYSNIGPRKSVSALGTAALLAQIGVIIGVPISFNQAIIASIIGSGLISGKSNTGKEKITTTVVAWISAFFLAIVLTYLLSHVLKYFLI